MAERGTYLYAIGRRTTGATSSFRPADYASPDTSGVAGSPVRTVEHHGLTAFVSTVDLDEFGEDGLRRNLEDLAWLETVARAHDRVVDTVSETGACAPLRLATIFLSDDGVRAELEARHDELVQALDRVDGRYEYGVKGYVDASADPEPVSSDAGAQPSGAAYLRTRKRQLAQREAATRDAAAIGDEAHAELSAQVVASRRYQPQERRLSGHEGEMILNGAYLVDTERSAAMESLVSRLTDRYPSARFELTGPWPPYSFIDLENT